MLFEKYWHQMNVKIQRDFKDPLCCHPSTDECNSHFQSAKIYMELEV